MAQDPENQFYQMPVYNPQEAVCILLEAVGSFAVYSMCKCPRLRGGVCMALAGMEEVMLAHGRVLPAEAVKQQQQFYLVFRAGYNKLADQALLSGVCRWPVRPKNHYLEHLVYDTAPLNGRFLSNYVNEDFVRRIKMLAAKSHAAFLSKHVCFKYALQCCMRWR